MAIHHSNNRTFFSEEERYMNPAYSISFHFFKIHFNIIPSTPIISKSCFPFRFQFFAKRAKWHTHVSVLDLNILIIFGKVYKS